MAKLNYQYQGGNSRRPPRGTSANFRLPLIFVIIALLTGGIIYLILPRDAATVTETPTENNNVQQENAPAPDAAPLPSPEESPAVSGNSKDTKTEDSGKPAPQEETAPEQNNTSESEAEQPKAGLRHQPSDFPEKGKPWAGDTPEKPPLMPENGENSAAWRAEAQALTEKHLQLIRDHADIPGFTVRHRVQSGESFSRIASKNDTTYDMIKTLSGFAANHNPNKLNVGQNLRLLPGPWHIVVEKNAKLLKLYTLHGGKEALFAVWDIGIGRQNTTPEGEFVIYDRLVNPSWTAPDGSIIDFKNPENPLGTRFLKLAKKSTPRIPAGGFGIHGTNDNSSVTRSWSSGCIRMRNADIETLFSIVPARSRVTVKE